MDGIVNLLKPPGPTSHDMVQKMRRLTKQKRIGHAGTLDPGACGVLVIGIGKGTRILEYLLEQKKTYIAEVIFGSSTSTADAYGEVVESKNGSVTKEELENVVNEFIGQLEQIPPMASAVKIGGKKLYELLREGKVIDREPREIEVYSLKIIQAPDIIYSGDRIVMEAQVSKGTYIRTLCQDIGERLGLPAHMGFLLRTASGGLNINNSLLLEEVCNKLNKKEEFLIPPDQALNFSMVFAREDKEKALRNGQTLNVDDITFSTQLNQDELVRLYSATKEFVGIYRYLVQDDKPILKPEKVLFDVGR